MTQNSYMAKSVSFDDSFIDCSFALISSKVEYVTKENEKLSYLNCSICLCPSIDPILCPNEHLFCRTCIAKNYEYRKKCPQCNVETDITTYIPAVRPIQNILDNLEVSCLYKNNGCEKIMTRKDLFEHIKNCQYMHKKCETSILNLVGQVIKCDQVYHIDNGDDHVHCKYADDGCASVLSKKQILDHEKTCEFFIMAPIFNKFKHAISNLQAGDQRLTAIRTRMTRIEMADNQLKNITDALRNDLTESQTTASRLETLTNKLQTDFIASQTLTNKLQTDLITLQATANKLQTDLIALQTTVNLTNTPGK